MSETVLRVSGLDKAFRKYRSEWQRILSWFGFIVKPAAEQWVLQDVSFSVTSGEAVGIIGQNGAGKSTLLKLITGTLRATKGEVKINGRVAAILELGMGFNPEFSARQNVFHAAGLMGFSLEIIKKALPEIEAFAEIGEYFDQPMRTYSSGMQVRVAFSIATAFRPEILIVDEALSVGDTYFQHKSFDRIRKFKEQGTSLLLVTHNTGDVRTLCDRVILLDKGSILRDGLPDEVIDYYNALVAEREDAKLFIEQRRRKDGWLLTEFGSGEAVLETIELQDAYTRQAVKTARVGQKLAIESGVFLKQDIDKLVLGHRITDRTGHVVWGTNTWHTQQVLKNLRAGQRLTFRVVFDCTLGPGSYAICFGLTNSETHFEQCFHKTDNVVVFDVVNSDKPFFIGSSWLNASFDIKLL